MATATRLPDFTLSTSGGGSISSDELRGRRAVLYFYPKDDTPGCTIEGREFSALRTEFD
ncbi:MAG TPA: redoxin domain-containing protein, partial [Candidatus Dormibacteraeota bacterium]|nr:redoxin domain-containing protein [Candidatus Dormibacteraeota bacterium]